MISTKPVSEETSLNSRDSLSSRPRFVNRDSVTRVGSGKGSPMRKLRLFIQEEDTGKYIHTSEITYEGTIVGGTESVQEESPTHVLGVLFLNRIEQGYSFQFSCCQPRYNRTWIEVQSVYARILLRDRSQAYFECYLDE